LRTLCILLGPAEGRPGPGESLGIVFAKTLIHEAEWRSYEGLLIGLAGALVRVTASPWRRFPAGLSSWSEEGAHEPEQSARQEKLKAGMEEAWSGQILDMIELFLDDPGYYADHTDIYGLMGRALAAGPRPKLRSGPIRALSFASRLHHAFLAFREHSHAATAFLEGLYIDRPGIFSPIPPPAFQVEAAPIGAVYAINLPPWLSGSPASPTPRPGLRQ
jgi:hypothetical protein